MTDMDGRPVTFGCTMRSCACELDGWARNPKAWSGRVAEMGDGWVRFEGDRHRVDAKTLAECYEVVA